MLHECWIIIYNRSTLSIESQPHAHIQYTHIQAATTTSARSLIHSFVRLIFTFHHTATHTHTHTCTCICVVPLITHGVVSLSLSHRCMRTHDIRSAHCCLYTYRIYVEYNGNCRRASSRVAYVQCLYTFLSIMSSVFFFHWRWASQPLSFYQSLPIAWCVSEFRLVCVEIERTNERN